MKLIADLASLGVSVSVINRGQNLLLQPQHKVTPEVIALVTSHKDKLIKYLMSRKGNPGHELEKLIPRMFKSKTCGCRQYARKMDGWGVDGCTERFDEIVAHLVKQAKKSRIARYFGPVNRIVAAKWLTQAIENARAQTGPVVQTAAVTDDPRWFVAVTTAPRKDPTLLACIDSLRKAGWEPKIFAEPGSIETDCQTFRNEQVLGVWHNWLHSAKVALSESDAEIILTVQDDIELHPESKSFAEEHFNESHGFLSLYTPKHYSVRRNKTWFPTGVRRVYTKSLWGACALVWPRAVLQQVVEHRIARNWLGAGPRRNKSENANAFKARRAAWFESKRQQPEKIANSDTAIGKAISAMNLPMIFVDPSPARHIAEHSTISHGGNTGRRNCIRCADHEQPLRDQVFPQEQK